MKLSDATKKLTCMKSNVVRVLAAAALAGAVLTAAAPAAQAQQFSVGVQLGSPRYVTPLPVAYGQQYGNGYYADRRFEDARRREEIRRRKEFERRQRWEREHRFHNNNQFDHGYHSR